MTVHSIARFYKNVAVAEEGGRIVAFSIDASSGRLKPTGFSVESGSPVCMVFSQHHA